MTSLIVLYCLKHFFFHEDETSKFHILENIFVFREMRWQCNCLEFILFKTSLRSQHRRGIPIYTHTSDTMMDMHSMLYNTRSGRLLLGGMQNKMLEIDMATGRELRAVNVEKGRLYFWTS